MALITSFFDDFTGPSLGAEWSPQHGFARTGNAEAQIYETAAVTFDGNSNLVITANSFANMSVADQGLSGATDTIGSGNSGTLNSTTAQTLVLNTTPTSFPTPGGIITVVHSGVTYYAFYTGVSGFNLTGVKLTSAVGPITLSTGDAVAFDYPYQSGEIDTRDTFLYGEFTCRAKFPPGNGIWPAFWLVESGGATTEEIDTMEWQGKFPTQVHNTYIWSYSPSLQTSNNALDVGVDMSAGYHIYGLIWSPWGLTWTFDGTVTKTWTLWDAHKVGTVIPNEAMTLIVNLALGSGATTFGGPVDATTPFPAQYLVDWVRVKPLTPRTRFLVNSSGQRVRARRHV